MHLCECAKVCRFYGLFHLSTCNPFWQHIQQFQLQLVLALIMWCENDCIHQALSLEGMLDVYHYRRSVCVNIVRISGDGPRKVTLRGTESQINYAKDLIDSKILLARERHATDPPKKGTGSDGLSHENNVSTKPPLLYLKSEEEQVVPLSPKNRQETLWDPSKTDIAWAPIIEVYVSSISGR